ncbi:MAG: WYL domain-containing protein [Gemmatimonadetes bacterium]|nr:WYL domain-containing protein [Gemmatimonadota bacterium]
MDLVAALLARKYGATLDELRNLVPGYGTGAPEAVRRAFERDKDELRTLGIPIDTAGTPGDAESRYLIRADRFYLPYLGVVTPRGLKAPRRVDRYGYRALASFNFTDDEFALLADAAARVAECGDPTLADDAAHALRKLALDVRPPELAVTPGIALSAPLAAADPAILRSLGDALLARKQVTFTYYGIERDETEQRIVLPYGLSFTSGHWYLHALDPSRGSVRRFRVSRMRRVIVNRRNSGSQDYEIPLDFRLAERAVPVPAWALGDESLVIVEVRFVRKNGAVRAARALGSTVRGAPDVTRYRVRRRESFLRWLLGLGGDAVPISPPEMVRGYRELAERTLAALEVE